MTDVRTVEDRLLAQGAQLGTIDAYGAAVRRAYAESIARTLRDVIGSADYSLGDVDREVMERIAGEIERMPR